MNAERAAIAAGPCGLSTGDDGSTRFAQWLAQTQRSIRDHVDGFVRARCVAELDPAGCWLPGQLMVDFAAGGKCVRSVFGYLGWLCGGVGESEPALRAAASLELLHAFALVQDDVMDESRVRRGRQSAHLRLAAWHTEQGLSGSAARFGESAAILIADLYLVWAERMLRESGVGASALDRAWPRYDAMRSELAVGQLADISNDANRVPTLNAVMDIARRKSGNYTVRRPLELGAAMADCDDTVLDVLGEYGELIGEAFQLRDDLLGVFGDPSTTGKPSGDDVRERKATTVVALADQLAEPSDRARLRDLWREKRIDEQGVALAQAVIVDSGAGERAEQMIHDRVEHARQLVDRADLAPSAADALHRMALLCTRRTY
ncbi:polyprenyl synthetase family protein [Nocardia caishijiensis]|uniref:Geranylgeranyl diphosphate synthase type I n=1 Tax=Nocardia caishijiensis TaxID=184756 RepID=A0ABQ6YND4_9NOCA|nr:polyprenyl synthetase family protein [Nocardia caishijiensis]KAF0847085.1 geranylgeranyl diphosphate synthase type I [Nocardia caishijiensis]